MSEHHIESIIEQTVGFLDAHAPDNADLRFHFLALYDFQYEFDTSITYFRVMDELLKHQFFFRLPLKEVQLKFKEIDESDDVLVEQDWVYARYDTTTAEQWSAAGLIDAFEPTDLDQISIANVVNRVAEIEREQNDFHYSYYWFAALAEQQLLNEDSAYESALNAFRRNPDIKAFRSHCKKIKAAAYVEENLSEYPFSDFQFDEMDLESSKIIRWLSGISGKRESLVDCFSVLDKRVLKRPSKEALRQRQALGTEALERAHKQKVTVNKMAELIGSATFLIYLNDDLGPWGAFYAIRFVSEAIKPIMSDMNQPFVCDCMVGLLCSADEFKHVLDGAELPDSYKELMSQNKRAKELIKIYYPANDNPDLFYADENGLALADYAKKLILTFPSKVAIESIYGGIVTSVIPKRRGHPFHLLETFRKIRNTKTKAKYQELLKQQIDKLSDDDRAWFDVNHALECILGNKVFKLD